MHTLTHTSAMPDAPGGVADTEALFGVKTPFAVPCFSEGTPLVPAIDEGYRFDPATTLALLAGFATGRRVLVQGWHGTGKSTHIEQVAARLNWPALRINLDGHVSRIDLIGRDAIVLEEGKQVTRFQEGLLPWALQRPVALVFDEYDAGRPDVMFVIQRVLEAEGKLTLLDQNRVIAPNPYFRLFATANTVGLGDASGMYHGTQPLNQGQMDRWQLTVTLNYLPEAEEVAIVAGKVKGYATAKGKTMLKNMVALAGLVRETYKQGELSTVMSPRTVLHWAENAQLFGDVALAFRLTFANRSDAAEHPVLNELYQRCFGEELMPELSLSA